MTPLTIYVVEDSLQVRDRMREMIRDLPNALLIGEADTETDAVRGIARTKPKLVILDINLKEGTGFDVLRQVKSTTTGTADAIVAVVTNFGSPQFREKCERLGADYFFDKTKSYKSLVELIHQLSNRHLVE